MNKFIVDKLIINTDASFHPAHKIGAYAFYIMCDHFKLQTVGLFKKGLPRDSNEAEMMSIANALSSLLERDYVPHVKELVLNTDSLNAIEEIIKQNTESGKYVGKLWQQVIRRTRSRKNELIHVAAHTIADNPNAWMNAWCDEEARKLMRLQIPQ